MSMFLRRCLSGLRRIDHTELKGWFEFDYSNGRVDRQSFLLPYTDSNVFLVGSAMYFVPGK